MTTEQPTPSDDAVTVELATPHGPARALVRTAAKPAGLLVMTHGAGGGISAGDLRIATSVAAGLGMSTALVEQPYRVAGRKMPPRPQPADEAWCAVIEQLHTDATVPLVTGGRSFGSRVACRTSAATGAAGVLCLAFPLHPPGRPETSRLPELVSVGVPTLVVQGQRDPFGVPDPATLPPSVTLALVEGDHSLRKDAARIRAAISSWLAAVLHQ